MNFYDIQLFYEGLDKSENEMKIMLIDMFIINYC